MVETPQVAQTADQMIAFIHLTVPRSGIQRVMGPGIAEVMATIGAQGIAPAGPWFTHHLRMDPAVFDFEICVPVTKPVTAAGRVQPGVLPAARVVRTVYYGPYEGLSSAWGEFDAWTASQGLTTGPDLFERYVAGPESGADPAGWRTELSRPLLDQQA
jgi:effector-binding domain-containing protein